MNGAQVLADLIAELQACTLEDTEQKEGVVEILQEYIRIVERLHLPEPECGFDEDYNARDVL